MISFHYRVSPPYWFFSCQTTNTSFRWSRSSFWFEAYWHRNKRILKLVPIMWKVLNRSSRGDKKWPFFPLIYRSATACLLQHYKMTLSKVQFPKLHEMTGSADVHWLIAIEGSFSETEENKNKRTLQTQTWIKNDHEESEFVKHRFLFSQ